MAKGLEGKRPSSVKILGNNQRRYRESQSALAQVLAIFAQAGCLTFHPSGAGAMTRMDCDLVNDKGFRLPRQRG